MALWQIDASRCNIQSLDALQYLRTILLSPRHCAAGYNESLAALSITAVRQSPVPRRVISVTQDQPQCPS